MALVILSRAKAEDLIPSLTAEKKSSDDDEEKRNCALFLLFAQFQSQPGAKQRKMNQISLTPSFIRIIPKMLTCAKPSFCSLFEIQKKLTEVSKNSESSRNSIKCRFTNAEEQLGPYFHKKERAKKRAIFYENTGPEENVCLAISVLLTVLVFTLIKYCCSGLISVFNPLSHLLIIPFCIE